MMIGKSMVSFTKLILAICLAGIVGFAGRLLNFDGALIGVVVVIVAAFIITYKPVVESSEKEVQFQPDTNESGDYLLLAANAKRSAKEEIKNKNYNAAWEHFHTQKEFLRKHSISQNWNAIDSVNLDASVSKDLANVLRLEGKHKDALVHIVYWYSNSKSITKEQKSKLSAYYNRSQMANTSLEEIINYCGSKQPLDFKEIRDQVDAWS